MLCVDDFPWRLHRKRGARQPTYCRTAMAFMQSEAKGAKSVAFPRIFIVKATAQRGVKTEL